MPLLQGRLKFELSYFENRGCVLSFSVVLILCLFFPFSLQGCPGLFQDGLGGVRTGPMIIRMSLLIILCPGL